MASWCVGYQKQFILGTSGKPILPLAPPSCINMCDQFKASSFVSPTIHPSLDIWSGARFLLSRVPNAQYIVYSTYIYPLNYPRFQSKSMIHWVSGTIDLSLFIKPPTNPRSSKQYLDLALVPSVATSFRTNHPFFFGLFFGSKTRLSVITPLRWPKLLLTKEMHKGVLKFANFPTPLYHHVRVVKNGY